MTDRPLHRSARSSSGWFWRFKPPFKICLVRGICGSLIRSNGAGKLGSRSRCRIVRASALFSSELPLSQFDSPGKRYAVSVDLSHPRQANPQSGDLPSEQLCRPDQQFLRSHTT